MGISDEEATRIIDEVIDRKGLRIVSGLEVIGVAADAAMNDEPSAVRDYRDGNKSAIGRLIGGVLERIKQADPVIVRNVLVSKLNNPQ